MRLGGLEQPAHRIARPRGCVQRAGVAAQARVAVDRLRAGHRQQLAAPFVQLDAQTEERLKAPAEAAARAADALGDRAHATAIGRVQVQDAVGLSVAHRAQHHRLGLDSSTGHAAMVIYAPDGAVFLDGAALLTRLRGLRVPGGSPRRLEGLRSA